MFVLVEIEGKSHLIVKEILGLLRVNDEVLLNVNGSKLFLLMDILIGTQVINWFLQNSMMQINVRRVRGEDISLFQENDELKNFLYKKLNVKEGQKWVVEQQQNGRYLAIRRARPSEIKAYGMKEDIIGVEAGLVTRIVCIGIDVQLDEIDFRYAIQYT